MDDLLQKIQFFISVFTLLGLIFAVYKTFRDPDVKADKTIAIMKAQCELKHKNIDDNILAIKENHLRHLEGDMAQVKIDINTILTILTILKEREKK